MFGQKTQNDSREMWTGQWYLQLIEMGRHIITTGKVE